ncbi:hypothetical protein F5Y12DRAFT_710160 [Xylaria sp. FL1777]|nr:hypothetical protein F5Y12DRAFT_710160 [Xylaria sp. FL1777]
MTTPSPTPSPNLPIDWVPTDSGCLRTTDLWIWDFGNTVNDARTVLGGPSQTTNCFASTWDPTVTYVGSGCPSHYTSACQASNSGAVTCCPTARDFTCGPAVETTGHHVEWFRCEMSYEGGGVVTVTRTNFEKNTIDTETRTKHTYEHLVALALMYTAPAPTTSLPTSSSDPSTTDVPSRNSSSGLTAGAAAGIGVGVAAAVIILALLGWFMYRRRRAARLSNESPEIPTSINPTAPTPMAPTPGTSVAYTYTTEDSRSPSQYLVQPVATPNSKELPAEPLPVFELHGDSNGRRS